MKKSADQLVFSASDLSNHIHCKHLTKLSKDVTDGIIEKPISNNRLLDVLRERGLAFETAYLAELEVRGHSIFQVNQDDTNAHLKTIEAMQKGFDYIYQARLMNDRWQGWADFMVKVDRPSNLGDWSYEVIDTKLASQTRAGTILQIALYTELIAEIQGVLPEYMHVRTPDNENVYRVNDYISYLRLMKNKLIDVVANPQDTYPEPTSHCDICNWWQSCNKVRRQDDHLSFIAGMGSSQIKEVEIHGVDTLEAMANLPLPLPFKPNKGSKETYIKLREQARLQNETRLSNKPTYEILDRFENAGFFNLPEPSDGDIYLDFEGDPLVEPSGLEYLFGWTFQNHYFKIWAMDVEQEKAALEQFMDFVFEKREQYPNLHIYHFSPYETTALKRIMGKYATKENEIDILLRTQSFVDLHRILRQSIRAGVERYSLKDLEKYHGYLREMDLRSLSRIKAEFEFLLESNKKEEITAEMFDAIQLYNQDDCLSTQNLHTWLESERQKLIDNSENIPRPIHNQAEISESINAHLQRIEPIYHALMDGISLSKDERTPVEQARFILANLLDWYRREDKSIWWEYFRLMELHPDEHLDEKGSLTFLQYTGERVPEKRSFIDTYTFPGQECELRVGDKIKTTEGSSAGEIVELDEINNFIKLKKGPSIQHIHPDTIIKHEYFDPKEKVETLIRFAEWVMDNGFEDGSSAYKATRDLLLNNLPSVLGSLDNSENLLKKGLQWATLLNNSYLPIQGPPGAGKSYTASHMIFDLIKKGNKIGITALSHKVIINLLEKVRQIAIAENFDLRIIYKGSTSDEEERPWTSAKTIDDIALNHQKYHIIAGTSFMWCNGKLNNILDYLFVDEAGQFALIDTVVVSHSTKNIILLGDHQQLKQPLKGIHPEGTDVSALEHILEDKKTIPEDRGIFLEKTWRMHPDICVFDSEMFYESRLTSVENLKNHQIIGNTTYIGAGLYYKKVMHEGNTNSSVEEVSEIQKIVTELIKGDVFWIDEKMQQHKLDNSHIKIITPYNNNVFELKRAIPNVEIGTVDKFQGQEAPIVIYSMASSTPEDAPRGMDFLYSPNRFNVAVSRAKAIFIMVGSPKLFEPDCKSPEQMKLANPFCRFMEMAKLA
jgi:predicted RecB family nuclease